MMITSKSHFKYTHWKMKTVFTVGSGGAEMSEINKRSSDLILQKISFSE